MLTEALSLAAAYDLLTAVIEHQGPVVRFNEQFLEFLEKNRVRVNFADFCSIPFLYLKVLAEWTHPGS